MSGKSKRGELSIFPKSFTVLSHCLHMMPRQKVAPGSDNAKVRFFFFCQFLFNQSTCYSQFSFYQVLQKTEIWVPGSGRNPDTYILKDQVLLIVSQSSFPFHSLHLQFIYFRSISFLISFSPFHDFAFRKHDIDNVIWT